MTTQPLAIIPARVGSKGVPNKNFRLLPDGHSLTWRAMECAKASVCVPVVSSDSLANLASPFAINGERWGDTTFISRPDALAQDDTPMIDVVRHVLENIPGSPDQKVVLLQPTSPFRTVAQVTTAIGMLEKPWTSVVSVVEVSAHSRPDLLCEVSTGGQLGPWGWVDGDDVDMNRWGPRRRQDATPAYRRDGTVYVFRRRTLTGLRNETIYGSRARPYILKPSESFTVDTLEDWAEAERRVKEQTGGTSMMPGDDTLDGYWLALVNQMGDDLRRRLKNELDRRVASNELYNSQI
jgi:N-acylneuraminate cytidylyltransferase